MAILDQFGLKDLVERFKESGGVHEIWNMLTLEQNLHTMFDRLDLWFESTPEVGVPETYYHAN
jgi:hypothetical protein